MPHLGGGVGKALRTLIEGASGSQYQHSILLLERPEKKQFVDKIIQSGCQVYTDADEILIEQLIINTDIVQLEWWNHPATFQFLCQHSISEHRLLVWCHVSGLNTPIIPLKLIEISDYFLFTSGASMSAKNVMKLNKDVSSKLGVVSSGVGFPRKNRSVLPQKSEIDFGYMGSLNSSKLYPHLIHYLDQIPHNGFKLKIWGDDFYKDKLIAQCNAINKTNLIEFKGYTSEPCKTLSTLDVFIYLLNPSHYGTAENVLLEAMSMGIVPIVMNNPAEMAIVDHNETGLIVSNSDEFVAAVDYLINCPEERLRMSENASRKISDCYSPEIMFNKMSVFYEQIILKPKKKIIFKNVLGKEPYEWYMACQENNTMYQNDDQDNSLEEETKGSLTHFQNYFPDDIQLDALYKKRMIF